MSKKQQLWAFWTIIGLGLFVIFGVLPGLTDRNINTLDRTQPLPEISAAAQTLHDSLMIVDLHADSLLWRRDLSQRLDHGHLDLVRLREGNVGIQVFGSVTKTPSDQNYDSNDADSDMITPLVVTALQPPVTWASLYQRSVYHAHKLDALAAANPSQFRVLRTKSDLQAILGNRAAGGGLIGGLLALEGAQALEGSLENLETLFTAGYRMVGLAHFFDNEVAGSMHGVEKYGLTSLGKRVVRRAEQLGMAVDIAHASPEAMREVLDMAVRPVVVSHTGVRATCDTNRNLTDDEIRRVAATGGMIGIGYWEGAVCDTTPAGIVAAMSHVRELVGADFLALGSDFDGATQTRFDTSELAVITQALLDAGFTETEIRGVMGENAVRIFRNILPETNEIEVL